VQVGMDTPHITVEDYLEAGRAVQGGLRVIGVAEDGGWWLLGLPDPGAARALADVPMSTPETAELTERALGDDLVRLRVLRDMDTWEDARAIARTVPETQFARVVQTMEAHV